MSAVMRRACDSAAWRPLWTSRRKTSLLRMLCGLLPPTGGEILWRGAPVGDRREDYLAAVTYVGHRSSVKYELTALENLLVSTAWSGWDVGRQAASAALARMGLNGLDDVPGRRLSEGQQRRVALARFGSSMAD